MYKRQDEAGYGNLMKLVSEAALATGGSGQPITTVERLAAYNTGLIALTGGQGGPCLLYTSRCV